MNLLALLQEYKSQLLYLFFGICTTLVNVAVYVLCTHTVKWWREGRHGRTDCIAHSSQDPTREQTGPRPVSRSHSTVLSTVIAWIVSVLFAYLTNRTWVFESQAHTAVEILREMGAFFLGRSATGALDLAIMYVCVDRIGLPDMPIKLLSNVVVVILNYVISKLIIFA